jgi:hypothetical protein
MELARYEGDGPPPVDNNKAGRLLWWGSRTLEGVMNHILAGNYPRMRYPHFQPPKKGGSERGGFVIWTTHPPSPQLEGPEEGPEWKAPQEYAMVANDIRCELRPMNNDDGSSEDNDSSSEDNDSNFEYIYYSPRYEYA